MESLETLSAHSYPRYLRATSFTYSSWKEFHHYKPYMLDQWKNSILFWWSISSIEITLFYIPKSECEMEQKGCDVKSYSNLTVREAPFFTVTIRRSSDDSATEIKEWLYSMRPAMWRLEDAGV